MKNLFWGIILLLTILPRGITQELLEPEQEAPQAIFEMEIGDAEVEFFLAGYWKSSLIGATGLLFGPDGSVIFPAPFPGLEQGLIPRQYVDLTFSIWLMERYFLEVAVLSVAEEQFFKELFKDIYFRLGYQGKEDEFLKHVYIGNRDIGITPFRFLDIPEQGDASLGAEALMGSQGTSHHLLLRSDNNEPDSLIFIGQNLATEELIPLPQYIQGKFFKLPDSQVSSLELYLEDDSGGYGGSDGRNYRRAVLGEAVLDSDQGLVTLKEEVAGRVLVYYRKGALEVGDPGLGIDALPAYSGDTIDLTGSAVDFYWGLSYLGRSMDERRVALAGKDCLRLWQPGEFSPFEILSSYRFSGDPPADLAKIKVQIIEKGDPADALNTPIKFRLHPNKDYFTAYYDLDLRGNFRNLYPFLTPEVRALFDPDNLLYGPGRDPRPGYLKYELLISLLTPITEYRLGGDIVPGSVRILRNGIQETRYEVDYDQGLITFLTTINPDDRLEVSFRRRGGLLNNSDLVFAWGNIIPLDERLTMELAAGLRWNALPGNYTEEAYSRTGTILGSASLKGEGERLKFDAYTGVAYTNPDTTGIMRLLSMEGQGMELALSEDLAYPAGAPHPDTLTGLAQSNRGKLLYKDYRSYSVLGTPTLMPYDWTPPAEQLFSYETGSKVGPYQAAGSSKGESQGESLVLDFTLDSGDWVGAQLPIFPEQGLSDLSSLRSITLSYRAIDVSGSVNLYLQIGEVGEDLDGDLVLDQERSTASGGFTFDDNANGVSLKVGSGPKNQGNNRRDSEDVDGNGFLDPETPTEAKNILTFPVATGVASDTGWKVLPVTLTASQRQQLRRVRGFRVLVVDNTTGSSGRLLIDDLILAGTNFRLKDGGFSKLTAREIEERQAISLPPEALEDAFPEVEDTFHPLGEVQEVLEVSWGGGPADWTLEGFSAAGTEGIDYRRIVLYYRLPSLSPGAGSRLYFSLLDADQRGIRWEFTPQVVGSWAKMEVSLKEEQVTLDEAELSGSSVQIDSSYGSLVFFRVSLENSNSGLLYLDELHLSEPQGALGAAFGLDLELSLPGELVFLGNHPLIQNLSFKEKALLTSRGFSTLYGRPSQTRSLHSLSELALSLSLTDLRMDLLVEAADRQVTLGGGHRIIVPNISFPAIFTDAYGESERASGRNFFRENQLTLSWSRLLSLRLRSDALTNDDLLTQRWGAELLSGEVEPVNGQVDLSLQKSKSGFSMPRGGYFKNWIEGYALLLPWPHGTELERRGNLNYSLGLNTRPLGFNHWGSLGFQSFDIGADSRRQRNTLELGLSFPLSFSGSGGTDFSLIPGYRRSLSFLDLESSGGDFGSDVEFYFYRTFRQEYLYNRFPVEELFAPEAEDFFERRTASLEEAFYTPEVFLALERSFGSRLRDLFLPSYVDVGVDKAFKKQGDLVDFFNNYRFTARSQALNLFGSLGVYPLFSFYRTDEFGSALTVTITAAGTKLRGSEWLLEHFLSFEGHRGSSFNLENRLRLQYGEEDQWSDSLGLLYNWYRYPAAGIRLPLLAPEIAQSGFWAHQERLELVFMGQGEQLSYHPLAMTIRHETAIMLPEHGYLKALALLGLDRERASAQEKYLRLGFQAGIEAKIEF